MWLDYCVSYWVKMLDVVPKVILESSEGQKMLNETHIKQTLLIRLFRKQGIRGFCGLTSAAHVMSSLVLALKYPEKSSHDHCDITDIRYTEGNIFEHKETQSVLGSAEFIHQRFEGTTLREIAELIKTHGMSVVLKSADESNVDEFRRLAVDALSSAMAGVIVNFHHDSKVEWGHFSHVAAYHEKTDRFLLMDTRQPYVWVTAGDLYPLINTLDPYTKLRRGYLIASSMSSKV